MALPNGTWPTQGGGGVIPTPTSQSPYANPYLHNVALGVTPIAALALLLPPRRLDFRLFLLGGVTLWGANRLVGDWTGRTFGERTATRMKALSGSELPPRAQETQERLRREREALRQRAQESSALTPSETNKFADGDNNGGPQQLRQRGQILDELDEQRRRRGQDQQGEHQQRKDRGPIASIWMGDASDDWKATRIAKEKEALQEGGEGYWGLISDHVSEAWGQLTGAGRQKARDEKKQEAEARSDGDVGKKL